MFLVYTVFTNDLTLYIIIFFFFFFFFLRYLCKIQLFGVSASHVAEFIFGYHYHLGPFSFLTLYVTGDQVHAFSTGFATHYG